MPDWIDSHKASIQFVIFMILGTTLIVIGATPLMGGREPGLLALGAGAIGLPGFQAATGEKERADGPA